MPSSMRRRSAAPMPRRWKARAGVRAALLVPVLLPYVPSGPSWAVAGKPPSLPHWFGTDELGRDVFGRVIYGARASLLAGAISVGIAFGLGVPFGLLSGY